MFSDQPNITKIEVQGMTHLPEGQNTSLLCQVDSYPLSNISWRYIYNNTLLIENNKVSKSYFNIASANCLDTGIYQCKAVTNIKGKLYSSTAQTNLNVICKYFEFIIEYNMYQTKMKICCVFVYICIHLPGVIRIHVFFVFSEYYLIFMSKCSC